MAGDRDVPSDEEQEDDNDLDQDYMPHDIAGEIEVQHDCEDSTEKVEQSDSKRWRKKASFSLDPHKVIPIPEEIAELSGLPAYDIFTKYLTPEMITFITAQTCQYAQRDRNDQTFNVSEGEIAKFLGIILASGYHHLPTEDSYWSTSEDLDAPIFRKIMSRERFRSIKKYLHIADNANLAKSKVAKVLPLFNMLKERCQQFGVFDELLSVDESMVPYRGLHSAKQYMRNKPVKFGYKVWMLCSA